MADMNTTDSGTAARPQTTAQDLPRLPVAPRARMRIQAASPISARGDRRWIEVRLNDLDPLFHSMDPAPFYEKDLDRNAEEFIVGLSKMPVRVVVGHPT